MKKCHVPIRQCVGCKTREQKKALLRFVHVANGEWQADPDNRLPGRGVYLCSPQCIPRIKKNKRYHSLVDTAQTTATGAWPTLHGPPAA